jgi:hypothetical protein
MTPYTEEYFDSAEEILKEYSIEFMGEGWYKRGNDYILITQDGAKLCVMIWNDEDPRPFWGRVSGLKLHYVNSDDIVDRSSDAEWAERILGDT